MLQATPQPDSRTTRNGASAAQTLELDALSRLDVDELGHLYAAGTVPASVQGLAGHPKGRMLAVALLDHGIPGAMIRTFAGASLFPWGGKSFTGADAAGAGVNRVHFGGRHQLFPFLTRIQASAVDGAPCIALDYDLPDNPAFIRSIHDEVREIEPGLYLGPAMWKTAHGPKFVLWFGLDTRVQANPIGLK